MRSWGLRRIGATVAGASVAGVVAAGWEGAVPPAELDLRGGGAWVASSAVGQLTLIEGGTAEAAARGGGGRAGFGPGLGAEDGTGLPR